MNSCDSSYISLLVVSWMNLCCMDNLGFLGPTASNFQWTPPIKSLPSPTLSSLPHPLSFLYATTCTPHASAVSFLLYWSIFPGLHTSVCSVMWAATIAQHSHPNLFDFNRQFLSLSGLNCTLIGGGLCCHTQGALLRHKAICAAAWYDRSRLIKQFLEGGKNLKEKKNTALQGLKKQSGPQALITWVNSCDDSKLE